MKDRKQRRTLSGAVLVMVLTVMFVLIILLMATLTVVTTANQRIYTKFEENQAYYTARSALDVFTQDMLSDGDYYAYGSSGIRKYKYTYEDTTVSPAQMKISPNTDMKQGLALQHELYKITSKSETYGGALGFAENPKASDNIFYTKIGGAATVSPMPENDFYTIETTNALNSDPDTTKKFDYIEYQVTLPAVRTSATDSYGRIVDTDSTGKQIAKIKVEVLSRVFNTNPSYTTSEIQTIIASGTAAEKQALKDAIRDGDRTKDQIRVRITSTVEFAHTIGTAVLIYDSKSITNILQTALTMTGGSGSDNMNVIGNVSVAKNVNWSNDGIIYGNVFGEGNWTQNTGADVNLTDGECMYVEGNFINTNSNFKLSSYALTNPNDKSRRPFFFVDGNYSGGNAVLGVPKGGSFSSVTNANAVDIITTGNFTGTGDFQHNGDIYCTGDCILAGANGVEITGDLYVGGDLVLPSNKNHFTIGGNLYVNGDLSQTGTNYFTYTAGTGGDELNISGIGGSIHVGTSISKATYDWSTNSVTTVSTDTLKSTDSHKINGVIKTDFMDKATLDMTTDTNPNNKTLEIELPGKYSPSVGAPVVNVEKSIPTHSSNYDDYCIKDKNGVPVLDGGGNTIYISAEQKAFTDAADMAAGNYSNKTFTAASFGGSLTAISTGTSSIGSGNYSLSPGNYTLTISGGGTVNILMDAGQYQGGILVADDKTTVNFYSSSAGTYELFNFDICNNDTKNAISASATLAVGDRKGFGIKAPKINYYFSKNSTIKLYNGGFLTGYVYAPEAKLESNVGGKGIKMTYNGNSVNSGSTVNVSVVGAVLCEELAFPNGNGMAYISPDLKANNTGGEPPLEWKTYQYKRD